MNVRYKQRYFCCVLDHSIAPAPASGALEKDNMLLMTKETTDKDRSLKTQMLLSTSIAAPEKISAEQVCKKTTTFLMNKPTSILRSREHSLLHQPGVHLYRQGARISYVQPHPNPWSIGCCNELT